MTLETTRPVRMVWPDRLPDDPGVQIRAEFAGLMDAQAANERRTRQLLLVGGVAFGGLLMLVAALFVGAA